MSAPKLISLGALLVGAWLCGYLLGRSHLAPSASEAAPKWDSRYPSVSLLEDQRLQDGNLSGAEHVDRVMADESEEAAEVHASHAEHVAEAVSSLPTIAPGGAISLPSTQRYLERDALTYSEVSAESRLKAYLRDQGTPTELLTPDEALAIVAHWDNASTVERVRLALTLFENPSVLSVDLDALLSWTRNAGSVEEFNAMLLPLSRLETSGLTYESFRNSVGRFPGRMEEISWELLGKLVTDRWQMAGDLGNLLEGLTEPTRIGEISSMWAITMRETSPLHAQEAATRLGQLYNSAAAEDSKLHIVNALGRLDTPEAVTELMGMYGLEPNPMARMSMLTWIKSAMDRSGRTRGGEFYQECRAFLIAAADQEPSPSNRRNIKENWPSLFR